MNKEQIIVNKLSQIDRFNDSISHIRKQVEGTNQHIDMLKAQIKAEHKPWIGKKATIVNSNGHNVMGFCNDIGFRDVYKVFPRFINQAGKRIEVVNWEWIK